MVDYVNAMIDPWGGMKSSMNTLQKLYTAKQDDQRLDQNQKRLDMMQSEQDQDKQAQKLKLMAIPFEYTKIKTAQMSKFAQTIKNLPIETRIQKYSDLINKIGPMPIAEHPTLGPLGTFNSEMFLPPEEFAKLDDEQQRRYLDAVTMTTEDISKFDLANQRYKNEADLINKKHAAMLEEIKTRGEQDRKTLQTGSDITDKFSQEEIDIIASKYNLTGKMPSLGRGKESTAMRQAIEKRAAQLSLESGGTAQDVVAGQADVKSIAGSLKFQEKQYGAMGSFVRNLDAQVDKVKELSKEFATFDTRLLNIPLRSIRGRLSGSPLQAKYDMYLTEIESEIGKLATGSTASVAELSQGAQEKWSRIHDKNLSIKDMISLLEETREAGRIRMKSVGDQLMETRKKMRGLSSSGLMQNRPTGQGLSPAGVMPQTQPTGQGIRTAEDYLRKLRGQ